MPHPDPTGAIELLGCEGGCLAGPRPISVKMLIDRQQQLLGVCASNQAKFDVNERG